MTTATKTSTSCSEDYLPFTITKVEFQSFPPEDRRKGRYGTVNVEINSSISLGGFTLIYVHEYRDEGPWILIFPINESPDGSARWSSHFPNSESRADFENQVLQALGHEFPGGFDPET